MKRAIVVSAVVLALAASTSPSYAASSSASDTTKSVTGTFTLYYNTGSCNGLQTIQMYRYTIRYTTTMPNLRSMQAAHLKAVQNGFKCDDTADGRIRQNTVTAPNFGTTYGFSWTGWPQVMLSGTDAKWAWAHGHILCGYQCVATQCLIIRIAGFSAGCHT